MEFHDRVIGVEELRRENCDRAIEFARDRIRVSELPGTVRTDIYRGVEASDPFRARSPRV